MLKLMGLLGVWVCDLVGPLRKLFWVDNALNTMSDVSSGVCDLRLSTCITDVKLDGPTSV